MFDKALRKEIGARIKMRRKELKLSLQYVADRMDVSASTIQRYEQGSIDNTKKLIVEGLAEVLHVSPEWLRGETDEMTDDYSDEQLVKIEDAIREIVSSYPLDMGDEANAFSKNLLLLLLIEFSRFNEMFVSANEKYTKPGEVSKDLAKIAKKSSDVHTQKEIMSSMFAWEIASFPSALNVIADCVRDYAKDQKQAQANLSALLRQYI